MTGSTSRSETVSAAAVERPHVVGTIPREDRPSVAKFREFVLANQPVILTSAADGWRAMKTWTLDYLRAALGSRKVSVFVTEDGQFRAHPEKGFHDKSLWKEVAIDEYIDWMQAQRKTPHYLLQNRSLRNEFPQLLPDIEIPPYLEGQPLRALNLWLGAGENVTPLHCDQYDNLLVQVAGSKRILLASPSQRRWMYPYHPFSRIPPVTSRVNIERPELHAHPRFKNVSFLEGTIQPGEMLFLPVHWWHQVYGQGINIAVNFWWKARLYHLWRHPSYMLTSAVHGLVHLPRRTVDWATARARRSVAATPASRA